MNFFVDPAILSPGTLNKDKGSTSKDGSEQLNSYEASIMYAIYTQLYMKKSSKNFGWSDYVKYIKEHTLLVSIHKKYVYKSLEFNHRQL